LQPTEIGFDVMKFSVQEKDNNEVMKTKTNRWQSGQKNRLSGQRQTTWRKKLE